MKLLKQLLFVASFSLLLYACASSPIKDSSNQKEKPVVIANDSLEYEVTIIDPGFTYFLNAVAQPEGYYSQNYLEIKNNAWVIEWNNRVRNPNQFNASIYENIVDYQAHIDYGYEVNYKLFNYFVFAQQKYKMNLGGGFSGRIR